MRSTDLKIQIFCQKDFLVSFLSTSSFHLSFFILYFSFLSLDHVKKNIPANCDAHLEESIFQTHSKHYQSSFRQALLQSLVRFYNKACLCCSDQEKTLSEHLNFYLIFIVYFYYSLPPDVAIPSMNCFWKIRYNTIIGIHASRDAAISCG